MQAGNAAGLDLKTNVPNNHQLIVSKVLLGADRPISTHHHMTAV